MTPSNRSSSASFKERYAVLLDIGRILTGTLRPDDLYRTIYEQASRVLETTGFYISLYDDATNAATVVFYADRGKEERVELSYRGSDSIPIREGRPTLNRVGHADEAILLLGHERDEVTRLAISAPMLQKGRVLGVISAQSYRPDAYTSDDLELLAAVADLAAVALDNARYVEETERRRREAERLEEIGRALSASLELPQVLERIIAAAVDLVEADSATVWLLRGETEVEIAMTGGRLPLPVGARVPLPVELCRRFLESRAGIAIDHVKKHPLLPPELRRLVRSDSGMVVPLLAEDQVIGALSIGHRAPREYRQEDVRLLERVSFHAAIAVANARLHERIRTLSLTDPLTGLPNRRHLEMFVEKEFAAARRGRRLAIVLFDLDHFKVYNDRAGHQAGDKALRAFADILASETRAMNLSARYGGDEFIAVLADSDRRGGLRHIARIAQAVERDPLLGPAGIRASAGVASYSAEVGSAEELIRAADRDLYRRKGSRNQHIPAS